MKSIILTLFLLNSLNCWAQDETDLYLHIDSLIQYELKYVYDSTSDQLPNYEWDSSRTKMAPAFSSITPNPSPLIIMDGQKINKAALKEFSLSQIASIRVYQKENESMGALYGFISKNGVIWIQQKQSAKRKK